MKVWILERDSRHELPMHQAFTTKEKAQECARKVTSYSHTITEVELDDYETMSPRDIFVAHMELKEDGRVGNGVGKLRRWLRDGTEYLETTRFRMNHQDWLAVYSSVSAAHACAVGIEKRDEYLSAMRRLVTTEQL